MERNRFINSRLQITQQLLRRIAFMKSTIQRVLFAVAVATLGAGAVGTAAAQTSSSAPTTARSGRLLAEDRILTIGMSFPLTGSLALQAGIARDAVVYAIDEANEKGTVRGYKLQALALDDASTTTGQ